VSRIATHPLVRAAILPILLIAIWQVAALALKTDSFPTALEAVRAEAPVSRGIMVGVEGEATDSNLATASGYSRNSWGIFVRGSW